MRALTPVESDYLRELRAMEDITSQEAHELFERYEHNADYGVFRVLELVPNGYARLLPHGMTGDLLFYARVRVAEHWSPERWDGFAPTGFGLVQPADLDRIAHPGAEVLVELTTRYGVARQVVSRDDLYVRRKGPHGARGKGFEDIGIQAPESAATPDEAETITERNARWCELGRQRAHAEPDRYRRKGGGLFLQTLALTIHGLDPGAKNVTPKHISDVLREGLKGQ